MSKVADVFRGPSVLIETVVEGEQTHFSALVSLAKKIVYFIFNLLTKTSGPHKGRLLVVVSFFVYFRRVCLLQRLLQGMNTTNKVQHI